MLGGYVAYSAYGVTDSYTLAVLSGALAMALFGVLFERALMSRVYGSNVLMQLLICYAVVLIFDDVVKIVWGPEFHAMGMPAAFQVPPWFIAGGGVPPFYAVLIGIAALIAIVLGLGLSMTRIGKTVRAAAINPQMVSALGVNTTLLFAIVFALGGGLAGLAGALAAPVRSLSPGMGFSILIESFIVTEEKRAAMGLPDSVPTGWWVGFQVQDPEVWAKVKSGERTGFSIHGHGKRTPHDG